MTGPGGPRSLLSSPFSSHGCCGHSGPGTPVPISQSVPMATARSPSHPLGAPRKPDLCKSHPDFLLPNLSWFPLADKTRGLALPHPQLRAGVRPPFPIWHFSLPFLFSCPTRQPVLMPSACPGTTATSLSPRSVPTGRILTPTSSSSQSCRWLVWSHKPAPRGATTTRPSMLGSSWSWPWPWWPSL